MRKSKYTVATAPPRIRKLWARKAARTRRKCAELRARHERSAVSPVQRVSREEIHRLPEDYEAPIATNPGFTRRYNPELLIVRNPRRLVRSSYNPSVKLVIRRKRRNTIMRHRRRRRRNPKLVKVIRFRGRRRSWKSLVKQFGVKGAKRYWRKKKKLCGHRRARGRCRKRRGRRRYFRRSRKSKRRR